MSTGAAVDSDGRVPFSSELRFGVGVRVFRDRRLLRQIRAEIARNVMRPEEIAVLENVTPEVLIAVLQNGAGDETDPAAPLRAFVASKTGYQLLAWRTTRKHPSKLHIIDAGGVALCGTPHGAEPALVDSGPCLTCATNAGLKLAQKAA